MDEMEAIAKARKTRFPPIVSWTESADIQRPFGQAMLLTDTDTVIHDFGFLDPKGKQVNLGACSERVVETVAALEPSETRAVLHDDFARLRREHPQIDAVLAAILAERVRRLSEEVTEAYYLSAEARVLRRLADLAELYGGVVALPQEALAELAGRMEVDVPTFLATVERYNQACEQRLEREPEFGKALKSSKAFDTPPYYAVQIFPLARKNFGGAKTDLKCRVLDKHFEPIGALYAAGEVAGMAGGHINGRAGL